jgi:tetratricopeptide (TPR) repeat protein
MVSNEIERAEEQLLAAREGAERDEEFQYSLTRFYMLTKQPEKAEQILRERVEEYPDQAGPMIGLAKFQYALGRPDDAFATLEEAMKIDPTSEEGRIVRSEFLLEQRLGDEEALAEVRQLIDGVLADNPASLRGQFAQGRILLLDKKYEEASILLRRVIEEQPDELSYYLLGTAYLGMGQNDLARAEFLSALRQNPQYVAARRQLAALYLSSDNPAAAAQEARRGLELEPDEHRLKLLLAEALVALRDAEEAGETLDSLELTSEEIPLNMRLRAADIYLDLARFDAARHVVEAALEKDPTNAAALQNLIGVESRAGQPTAALAAVNKAIEVDPENAELYRLRGQYYMGFRRPGDGAPRFPNEAQADLLQAEALEPDSSRTQVMLGRLRKLMGSDRQALEAFDKAIELNPANGEAYMLKGAVLEAQGRLDAAAEAYRVLLERPDRGGVGRRALAIAMNNLAWLLADHEKPAAADLDRALELAQDAKELMPDDPSVADTLGWVMYKRAIPSAAISLFREAIDSYEPGSPTRALSRYHLALSYEASGDPLRAIEELKLSLKEAEAFPGREDAEAALERLQAS